MAFMCLYGYGECDACGRCEKTILCPICGEEVTEHLFRRDGEIVGCDQCIDIVDVEDYEEER